MPETRLLFETKMVAIGDLKPNKDNPRKISHSAYRALIKSLTDFPEMMQANPLIIDGDNENVVLSGNQRLKAIKELRWTEVPVIDVKDLTEEQKQELAYKVNKHNGEFDEVKLFEIYEEDKLRLWGHDFKKSPFQTEMEAITDDDAEMPIVPLFDEKHGCVVIMYETENEKAYLETVLQLQKEKAYNSTNIATGYVIRADKFTQLWQNR